MIRVALVDDHDVVRSSLARLLELTPGITVAAATASAEEFLALDPAVAFDVVLMDLSMPGMNGVDATRATLEARPDVRVVILSAHTERSGVVAALDAGAVGYLVKDADPETLAAGIREAAGGSVSLDRRAQRAMDLAGRPTIHG